MFGDWLEDVGLTYLPACHRLAAVRTLRLDDATVLGQQATQLSDKLQLFIHRMTSLVPQVSEWMASEALWRDCLYKMEHLTDCLHVCCTGLRGEA